MVQNGGRKSVQNEKFPQRKVQQKKKIREKKGLMDSQRKEIKRNWLMAHLVMVFFALNSTGNLSVMLSDSKVTSRMKFLNQK